MAAKSDDAPPRSCAIALISVVVVVVVVSCAVCEEVSHDCFL